MLAWVVSQESWYGAVVSSLPRLGPSSLNWTPGDTDVVGRVAATVTVPDTVAPSAGCVTETDGGVVSGGGGVPPTGCSCRSGSRLAVRARL